MNSTSSTCLETSKTGVVHLVSRWASASVAKETARCYIGRERGMIGISGGGRGIWDEFAAVVVQPFMVWTGYHLACLVGEITKSWVLELYW